MSLSQVCLNAVVQGSSPTFVRVLLLRGRMQVSPPRLTVTFLLMVVLHKGFVLQAEHCKVSHNGSCMS